MHEHQPNLTELPASLRSAVEQILAEPIASSDVRRALVPLHRIDNRPANRTKTWRRAWLISALAAALLLGFWILQTPGRAAWADVVDAVAGRPWLHGAGKTSDGQVVEFWYSGPKQIMASKSGPQLLFQNGQQGILEIYDGQAGPAATITRLELSAVNRDMLGQFQALLDGKLEKFLAASGANLVERTRRAVTVGGKPREEYRFVIVEPGSEIRTTSTLSVDPETSLPTRWELESTGLPDGQKLRVSCELNYPKSGPETIYALGAPRSAPIDDNVPRGDLKKIVMGLAQGRTQFDNYRGIAVTGSTSPIPDGSGPALCYQVWRKGLKWRIELCQLKGDDRLPPGAKPSAWWNEQVANSRHVLKNLSDGTRYCEMKPVYAQPVEDDPANPRYMKIASFTKDVRTISEPTDPWRNHYIAEMPEIVGHLPLMGENSGQYGISVNINAAGGPTGCVLVESLRRDNEERKLVGRRFWIDPARGYLVMRDESLAGTRESHKVAQAAEIIGIAQDPSGHWYPTQLRLIGGSVSLETGNKADYFNNYYLDFDVDIPDSLFDIPM